jgi:hypothetical protein
MSVRDPFEGFPQVGLHGQSQQPLVSPGFSGKGMEPRPGSLAYSIGQRTESRFDYGNLKPIEVNPGADTPQLSRVSKQDYRELERNHANELLQSRLRYHHDTYPQPQSVEPSPAPQSRFGKMFNKAKKYASFWKHQRQQRPQQHQQQQQRPHTIGPSSLEKINNALRTLGLSINRSPTYADVKKAYNKVALATHPNTANANKANTAESPDEIADRIKKFIKANEAYVFLMDNLRNQNGGNVSKIGGNNTIKRRHKKHKLVKKTRGKKHSNRRSKTRGKTYRKTRKNTTKRRR